MLRFQRCFQPRIRTPGTMAYQAMRAIQVHQASAQDTRRKRQLRARPLAIQVHQASVQDTRRKRRLRILKPATTSNEHRARC